MNLKINNHYDATIRSGVRTGTCEYRVLIQFRQLSIESSKRKYLSVYAGENHIAVVWSSRMNKFIMRSSNNTPGTTQGYYGLHVYVDISY